jgi:hypothetical protein
MRCKLSHWTADIRLPTCCTFLRATADSAFPNDGPCNLKDHTSDQNVKYRVQAVVHLSTSHPCTLIPSDYRLFPSGRAAAPTTNHPSITHPNRSGCHVSQIAPHKGRSLVQTDVFRCPSRCLTRIGLEIASSYSIDTHSTSASFRIAGCSSWVPLSMHAYLCSTFCRVAPGFNG